MPPVVSTKPPSARLLGLALRRCRDAEIVWEERLDLDLASPEQPRRLSGWGLRVNYEGGLGFSWGDVQEAPEQLLEQALQGARENLGEGVLFSHGLPFTGTSHPLDEVDLAPGLDELQRLVARIQFLLPSLLPGWTARIRGGVRFQRMTLVTRSGEQTAHRTLYVLAVQADSPAPLHASVISTRVPDSPGELLCELAWRAAHGKPGKKGFESLVGERAAVWTSGAVAALVRDLVSDRLDAGRLRREGRPLPEMGPWLSPRVTLADDGTLAEGPGSTPFDAEGQTRRRVELIRAGSVRALLADRQHARWLGVEPAPLAVRDWSRPPRPGWSNLAVDPGRSSLPDLVREGQDGVLLDHLVACDAPREPGEFCRLAQLAYRLKAGRPTLRLEPVLVRGLYADLLGESLSGLSRERNWHGRCLTPAMATGPVRLESAEGVCEIHEEPGTWW